MLKSPCFAKHNVVSFYAPYKLLILSLIFAMQDAYIHTYKHTHTEHMGSKGGRFIPYTLSPERKRPYTVPDSFRAQCKDLRRRKRKPI